MTMPDRGRSEEPEFLYSPVVQGVANGSFVSGSGLTWDAFARQIYETTGKAIQQQSDELVKRGNVMYAEAKALVETTRNRLVLDLRAKLTPFGRLYSESLKPRSKLPTLDSLLARKGTIEAVLTSVGKSRTSVNALDANPRCRTKSPEWRVRLVAVPNDQDAVIEVLP